MTKNLAQVHQVFQLILNSAVEKEQTLFGNFFHFTNQKSNHTGASLQGKRFYLSPPNFEHHFSPPGSPLHSIVSILIWPQAYQSILLLKSWPILAPIHNHHPDCPISQIHSQQAKDQPKHIVTRVSTCTFFAPIYNHHLNFPKFQISTEMTYLASIYNHHPNRPIFQILTVLKYFSVSLQPPSKLAHFSN